MTLMRSEPQALTLAEAADALRVSPRHLQTLFRRGDGPPVIRLGRRRVIRREALDRWLAKREATAA